MLLAMTHGVDWPRTPVDRLQDFRPAFCPRKDCRHHTQPDGFRCRKHGSYGTARGVEVPRYRCMGCGSTFSRRAFSLIYYRKRPELLRPVAAGLQAGSAHRQLARTLGCAPSTVTRISARLGRHALLLLRRALAALEGQLDEPVVLDHFETFELTQDLPFGVATPVGARSWFVYGIDPAPHARTGRRSPKQERRRKRRARRPKRGGYGGSATRVFECLLPLCPSGRPLQLIGDGHPAYDQAVQQHRRADSIALERHPNPPRGPKGSPRSARAIARDRAMFPADLLHGLLRHSLAAHKRETIAFGRRLNAIVERLFLVAIWRNFVKGVSERRNDSTTPAMRLGLTDRPWKWERVLGRRLFPDREKLAGIWLELYRRDWTTPELPCNTRHRRVFAY
jgi:transposase-like protein